MGGDHKCPLCSATFTRPQHVGRHLRAHTGDRPYECKECPLRFARSDLLSRHVNKAHRPPGENDKKDGRKGRRKSMSSQHAGGANGGGNDGNHDTSHGSGGVKPRAASFSQFGQELVYPHMDASGNAIDPSALMNPNGGNIGSGAGGGGMAQPGHITQTALPAHQLYPNHPLLANSPRTATSNLGINAWQYGGTQPGVNGFTGTGADYSGFNANLMSGHSYGMPFTATPMRMTGSEQGIISGSMGRVNGGNYLGMSIDYGTKKRACDQSRCTTRNLGCSYNKPPKSRSIVQPMPWASRITTTGLSGGVGQSGLSLSPTTQYSSPTSASNVSPVAGTSTLDGGISSVARSFTGVPGQHGRSQSFGAASQFYAPTRPGMPVEAYSRTFPALQGWQGGMQQEAMGGAPMSFDYVPLGAGDQQQGGQGQFSSPQSSNYYPYGTTGPQTSVGTTAVSPSNGTMQPPAIIPASSRQVSGSTSMRSDGSNGSPAKNLAPTPALSNSHTTSPSSSDDSAERRMSSFGSSGSAVRPEPAVQGLDPSPPPVHVPVPSQGDISKSALALSPSSMQPYSSLDASMTGMSTEWVTPPQPVTMGANTAPQQQNLTSLAFAPRTINQSSVSLSTAADEDENGNTLSRSDSLLDDGGQVTANVEAHRRRSSGVWAQAFSGMSLQDPQLGAPVMISDPFSASQLASQAQAQAEAQFRALQQQVNAQPALFSANHGSSAGLAAIAEGAAYGSGENGQGEMPMPSMSDVKDLWKLFVNDPMTGFTPAGEKGNGMDQTGATMGIGMPLATPRPNLGERTLSKSNSMPDLTSPFLGQAFFSQYFNNAVTPRPGDGPLNGFDMLGFSAKDRNGKRADGGIPAAVKAAMAQQAADGKGKGKVEVVGPDEVIEPDGDRDGNDGTKTAESDMSEDQQKAMNKWKTALSRPSNFAFQLNNPKVGGRNSASNSVSPPADPTPMAIGTGMGSSTGIGSSSTSTTALNLHVPESRMNQINMKNAASMSMNLYPGMASTAMGGGMRFDLSGRPSASVIQARQGASIFKNGFGAMNQTLAPERAPSFMTMTPGIGAGPSGGLGSGMGMGNGSAAGGGGLQVTPPKGRNPLQATAQYNAHVQSQASGLAPNANAFPPPPMFTFTSESPLTAHPTPNPAPSNTISHHAQLQMPISEAANALASAATAALGGPSNVRPAQSHKGSSATTRPGNKRLASQILGGEGKKATFGLWDDEETDVEYVQ